MKTYEGKLSPPAIGKLWLLAALFLVLLPHLTRMPLLISIACTGAFALRLAHEIKGWSLPRRSVKILITIGAFVLVAVHYKTVVGRDAGIALLSIMLCLKLLELRTLRDAMIALYLGYFLVIGSFLFNQSIYTGAYLLLVVLLLTSALIALNHPFSSTSNTRFYLRYAGQLLLLSFPLMMVMFLLFPRLSGPLWSMPHSTAGKTGLSDQIRMGTISSLVESEEVAFRVDFNGEIPAADNLYWRGPVLWKTDGRLWQQRRQPLLSSLPNYTPIGGEVEYTVTLEDNGYHWLFTLDLPVSLPEGSDHTPYVFPDFQVVSKKPITSKQRYTLRSNLDYRTTEITEEALFAALQLPEGINPRTIALAHEWLDSNHTPEQIIERAQSYYRQNDFYYSRNPPLLDTNPVDDFLFNTRKGFCEHYATSFVTLMRAADIPARVVTGYQGGENNQLGNYLTVRQSNAHAWAEVWLEDKGWVRIDPTTNIPAERVEETVDTQRFVTTDLLSGVTQGRDFNTFMRGFYQARQLWDAINYSWNYWVLGFDKEQQEKLLKALGLKDSSMENLLMTLVFAVVVIVLFITSLILLKRPRHIEPVQRQYQRFCRKLEKLGTIRRPNEGPHSFAVRACSEQPSLCNYITKVTQLYVTMRYTKSGVTPNIKTLRQAIGDYN